MNIHTNALAGINLSQGVGTMAGGSYGCLAMAVIGDELIGMAKRFVRGIRVDDESLAVDLIGEVGPGGHFLKQAHTARLFRSELHIPGVFDRQAELLWSQAGSRTTDRAAADRVREILAAHRPEPLTDAARREIDLILERAAAEGVR